MVKCANPCCGEMFVKKELHQKFCCGKCSAAAKAILVEKKKKHFLTDDQNKSSILMRNGIEIRNDCMGKEITTPLTVIIR